eukprot:2346606-Prymnesium_polylepis.1
MAASTVASEYVAAALVCSGGMVRVQLVEDGGGDETAQHGLQYKTTKALATYEKWAYDAEARAPWAERF